MLIKEDVLNLEIQIKTSTQLQTDDLKLPENAMFFENERKTSNFIFQFPAFAALISGYNTVSLSIILYKCL